MRIHLLIMTVLLAAYSDSNGQTGKQLAGGVDSRAMAERIAAELVERF